MCIHDEGETNRIVKILYFFRLFIKPWKRWNDFFRFWLIFLRLTAYGVEHWMYEFIRFHVYIIKKSHLTLFKIEKVCLKGVEHSIDWLFWSLSNFDCISHYNIEWRIVYKLSYRKHEINFFIQADRSLIYF